MFSEKMESIRPARGFKVHAQFDKEQKFKN